MGHLQSLLFATGNGTRTGYDPLAASLIVKKA
jgi:hypothetical protein